MQIQPLTEGLYFHIYNRGVNSENIFKERKSYSYFLKKYAFYCSDVLETYAYSLLKNHFHLVAYVKEKVEVPKKNGEGLFRLNAARQLSHFFNSYAQSINKSHDRTGPLFESPFERKLIDNDSYLTAAICYCHHNPQLHGFTNNFKEWEFSSYQAIVGNDSTIVSSQKVITLFGNTSRFEEAHKIDILNKDVDKYGIEYDKDEFFSF